MPVSLRADFQKTILRLRSIKGALAKVRVEWHRAIGVQVVAWAIQDYRAKARHGADAAGASWKPITRAAIATRLAARAPWQSISLQLAALWREQAPILAELRRKLPRGKTPTRARQRGAIAAKFTQSHSRLKAIKRRRAQLRARRQRDIDREFAHHEIGVDTGRLINSLTFGEPALASIRAPKQKSGPPPSRAIFLVSDRDVTVGSNMSYAKYFDEARPIFSANMITPARRKALEDLGRALYQRRLGAAGIEGGGA